MKRDKQLGLLTTTCRKVNDRVPKWKYPIKLRHHARSCTVQSLLPYYTIHPQIFQMTCLDAAQTNKPRGNSNSDKLQQFLSHETSKAYVKMTWVLKGSWHGLLVQAKHFYNIFYYDCLSIAVQHLTVPIEQSDQNELPMSSISAQDVICISIEFL